MISVPLVTMNQNSRSLGTFIENFKDTIHFQSYNDKILDDSVDKVVVFFEYLGDNDYVFKTFVNCMKLTQHFPNIKAIYFRPIFF